MSGDSNARFGKSDLFNLNHIGGELNTQPNLIGLKSFTLVPEPTVGTAMGLAVVLTLFPNRKRTGL